MSKFKNLLVSAFLVTLTAGIGGYFTRSGTLGWYVSAAKPAFTPPDSVFPTVWGLLYITLAISFYIVLNTLPAGSKTKISWLFISQLLFQILWCFTFFYLEYTRLALIVIVALDIIVWQMIRNFQKINTSAGYILYPYFIWICFATYLNFAFIIINEMTADQ